MALVKICGVTRAQDAERAVGLGAWAIGLNFWPHSSRHIEPGEAAVVAASVRRRCEVAGVFVNAELATVVATAEAVGLTMLQFHGDEGPALCAEAARRTGCRVIKAFRPSTAGEVRAIDTFRVDFHLVDAAVSGSYGGTGEPADWALLARRRSRIPLILAGGLDAENIGEAIRTVRPHAVDVASGVESSPGVKDPAKLIAFFRGVQATVEAPPTPPSEPPALAPAAAQEPEPEPPAIPTPAEPRVRTLIKTPAQDGA
ncbi:MAG: phosphoribosylanthranilate isomerase [Solirubrobacterales bacterium]